MSSQQLHQALATMPEDLKAVALAFSLLLTRIKELSEPEKKDLFELLEKLPKVVPDERQSIFKAMEEILTRLPSKPIVNLIIPKCEESRGWAKHVAKLIKQFRNEKGWSQLQLAKRAELPQSHISRLESAEHSPSHKTLVKLAMALGKNVRDFDPSID